LLDELNRIGVNGASLFPDLTGFGEFVNWKLEIKFNQINVLQQVSFFIFHFSFLKMNSKLPKFYAQAFILTHMYPLIQMGTTILLEKGTT
jgi:hypothetical protein